ncbi:MAG: mycofactocin-associated electron transfer flavoprotein alpha subunit [Acidimicrobiales bacterium]
MIAVVPVRAGELPIGGDEAAAEAGGRVLLIGDRAGDAVAGLHGVADEVTVCEQDAFTPGAWSAGLAALVEGEHVLILPASPDGRDLAPRLAHLLDRPLLTGAVQVTPSGATVARHGGLVMEEQVTDVPFVATLQPGVRGVEPDDAVVPTVRTIDLPAPDHAVDDAVLVEVLPPDPATMDLAEAPRIVGGGAGLRSIEAMDRLAEVATALGCSIGGTRVVTDWGWLPYERQIGTTGVAVHPDVYLAFGISGAVQHTAGLGSPRHVIAVNTDASCPMMALADLAIVTDAPALVDALARRLGVHQP